MTNYIRTSLLLIALHLCAIHSLQFMGVSEAGGDFGGNIPGTYGSDYVYPTTQSIDYFVAKGMNIIRVPFRWERVQRTLNGPLDSAEMSRLDAVINYITSRGTSAVLDPHNYARYNNQIIGQGVSYAQFQDFWSKLADHYKGNSLVIFNLMNEPNTMPTENWGFAANASIQAIRATGATNQIQVPGNAWTGAHSWADSWYGTPNAQVMGTIVDPLNNFVYDVHQYLDSDSSGTSSTCVSTTIGSSRLQTFTTWARSKGKKGFLGEFAGANNPTCASAVNDMLSFMERNSDVWIGWTWWAAGPWWGGYLFSIEPGTNGVQNQPMMAYLTPFLTPSNVTQTVAQTSAQTSVQTSGTSSVIPNVCSARYQCSTYSVDYNFMDCVNNVCICARTFAGTATAGDLCRCDKFGVYWSNNVPLCLSVGQCVSDYYGPQCNGPCRNIVNGVGTC